MKIYITFSSAIIAKKCDFFFFFERYMTLQRAQKIFGYSSLRQKVLKKVSGF